MTLLVLLAIAAAAPRVEVVAVQGIIDAPTERAIVSALRVAEREGAEALVLQIDSAGAVLGAPRAGRLVDAVRRSTVPVVTWIGPPGARARGAAAALAAAGDVVAMAPGSSFGPAHPVDLRSRSRRPAVIREERFTSLASGPHSAQTAEDRGLVDELALSLPDLLRSAVRNPDDISVRFRGLDLPGRVQHAVAQPSIAYLLLLLGLVGLVFELFHPSRGPAGTAGLLSLALALYGIAVLQGSWLGAGLIVVGVAGFCVDLRVQGLGVFTLAGFAALVAGSVLLFPTPTLRASPWALALGIAGMVAFLIGAMTRVLRDLRAVSRGDLKVADPQGGAHAS